MKTCNSALLTDLYELTMAAAYFEDNFCPSASFEIFVRTLPSEREFLLAAGLEQALEYLEGLDFEPEEIEFLRRHPAFSHISEKFWSYLKTFRFHGEIWAVPEGTAVFANEPLLRVTAPIIEAQIVETFLLATLGFQTLIATKAARVVEAAQGRGVVEFGSRRAHGPEAGMLAARAAYIGGCVGTSNVEAGHRFHIPTFGTMAHSFVMAYGDEEKAFRQFSSLFPEHNVLLLDTYDTLTAVDRIIDMGLRPQGVRLDSGNLVALSKEVRRRLDAAGLKQTRIFASGDLQEDSIAKLISEGAPIDEFGVGTALATSADAPALGGVYKLVEVSTDGKREYRSKFSEGKVTFPGSKQVFRVCDSHGMYDHDVIACQDEKETPGQPLLTCVMREGRRLTSPEALPEIQQRARQALSKIPPESRKIHGASPYRVTVSKRLERLVEELRGKVQHSVKRGEVAP